MLEAERHDPERVKRWVVLVDGAETQLDLVEVGAAAYGVDVTVILDIIHVVEYVWKAAHVFHREGSPDAAHWAWTRVQSILEGKARRVAAAMRRAATVARFSRDTRKPVDLLTPPSPGQVALAMPLAAPPGPLCTADEKEPHPTTFRYGEFHTTMVTDPPSWTLPTTSRPCSGHSK